ncbi:CoA transferase [Nocardioides zeae]|uniref:CoA transferase n=1 Tax=Nocardioides zeae TaxID=1457234 RepID=A0A6P0HGQ3_9ACTN|nr:CoA transferase [Nocardioides zeae]
MDGFAVGDLAAGGDVAEVAATATRLLGDLGARVLRHAPGAGRGPGLVPPLTVDGVDLGRAVADVGAEPVALSDSPGDQDPHAVLAALAGTGGGVDAVVVDLATYRALDVPAVRAAHPHLVLAVVSPFGSTGPRADWVASERTLYALDGSLSRSGRPGAVPLLPPEGIGTFTAAVHLAWTVLVAVGRARRTGRGQVLDVSVHEAMSVGLDPAFGTQGSAAAGRSGPFRRDRPPADSYPVFACADGHVRLCLLAKRQWRAMLAWLGSPAELADPALDTIAGRARAADVLHPRLAALFADRDGADLVAEAASRGIPLAQVLTVADVLHTPHFAQAGSLVDLPLGGGRVARTAAGPVVVDGVRLGAGPGARGVPAPRHVPPPRRLAADPADLPLAGVRVLDLGVIVFGAEVGRALGDLGADVVKVESLDFPDGLRQTFRGEAMNASFAWGQRNKRSLGLDLRSSEGAALFRELARDADVVLSNFKPGTLASLGIDHAALAAANPGIVVVESAAFSSGGEWARRLGYGPLVRAACGISGLWRYDADAVDCWDGVTVHPDHVAAKVAALAVLALLERRERTGRGGAIEVAQSDVVLAQLAPWIAAESARPGTLRARGNAGRGLLAGDVVACLGDDEWVVVDARTPAELAALAQVVGTDAGAGRAVVEEALHAWAAARTPLEAATVLQAEGVPTAPLLRLPELKDDPQLVHRGTYRALRHPLVGDLPTEDASAAFEDLPPLPVAPAPLVGEHTRAVLEAHGTTPEEVERLLATGVVHEGAPAGVPA